MGDHRRLHDLLLELRRRAGEPSLRKINGVSEVSVGHLSEVFAGKTAPGPDVAVRIARALKATDREQARVRFYAEGIEADRSAQRAADTRRGRRSGCSVVRVGRVPLQAAWFQDRHTRIDLARAARAGRNAVLTQVLSGLGGVGKTQLAAQFARRLDVTGELDVLVWVTAASRDAIVAAYTETARAVRVCGADVDPRAAAARLLNWLEHTDQRWLIVLDNLDIPADASGLWPPDSQHGRTVITTRRRDPLLNTNGRTLIMVDLFTAGEATDYFARATGAQAEQHADVQALAADLGYLPLAVAQAAAFIRDRGIGCAVYRQRLANRRETLDSLAPPADARPDDYQPTVAATWSLSVDAANGQPPRGLARPLLDIAALVNPNGIPAALFTTDAVATHLATVLDHDFTTEEISDGLRNLHRLHLITHDPDNGIVRVHALVQRAARDQLDPERLTAAAHAAADALHQLWPDLESDAGTAQPLRANANILHQHTGHVLWTTADGAHPVLFLTGNSLGKTGQASAARDYFNDLHITAHDRLGPEHPDTLSARRDLAWWRGRAGDPGGAAAAFEQLFDDYLRILGPEHPDTLSARRDLTRWQGQMGDPDGAATALERLLDDYLRILGPAHPDTLTARHSLAWWRGEAGDPDGAAAALEQLLDDYLRILGPEHPDTLTARQNLASWRKRASG